MCGLLDEVLNYLRDHEPVGLADLVGNTGLRRLGFSLVCKVLGFLEEYGFVEAGEGGFKLSETTRRFLDASAR